MGIPLDIRALNMNDGDVRLHRSYSEQTGAAERIVDRPDAWMSADDVASDAGEGGEIRQTHGGRFER